MSMEKWSKQDNTLPYIYAYMVMPSIYYLCTHIYTELTIWTLYISYIAIYTYVYITLLCIYAYMLWLYHCVGKSDLADVEWPVGKCINYQTIMGVRVASHAVLYL